MKEAVRQTRSHLMKLFKQHGFNPRTDLGQNFLIDLNILEFVIKNAELNRKDVVLEVGAGTGGMTTFLALKAAEVVSFEIDSNMYGFASHAVQGFDNVALIHSDALKSKNHLSPQLVDLVNERLTDGRRLKLVANLPYSIATPLVSNIVATELDWSRMVITIQWELGQRMAARPRRSNYGALSVWLQSQCHVKILRKVPPTVFWPRPKVDSAIVRLIPAPEKRAKIRDRAFLLDFVRRLFHQRRKLLRGMIVGMYRKQLAKDDVDDVLAEVKIKEGARAEELAVPVLVELANKIHERIESK
ncbi:MAG: ribosomal RNA small subunit methyltransferase A [Planctomycetaceae bacterium]|nr:ribosomal RNA small subunit methyltransferase A [Planctomycetaceae bacterium]